MAYITEPQSAGDYYSEADQAFMMWHTTERAAVELGIAKAGEQPSQQEVLTYKRARAARASRTQSRGGDMTIVGGVERDQPHEEAFPSRVPEEVAAKESAVTLGLDAYLEHT